MAQKPVIPKSRKTVERAKKQAAKGSVKEVKKAVGARGSTLGNIDSLVNKHLASFRKCRENARGSKGARSNLSRKISSIGGLHPRRRSGTRNTHPRECHE